MFASPCFVWVTFQTMDENNARRTVIQQGGLEKAVLATHSTIGASVLGSYITLRPVEGIDSAELASLTVDLAS